jgi:hypothetical protein
MYSSKPVRGGFEDFTQPPTFTSFVSTTASDQPEPWDKTSMLGSLLHYFCRQAPPGFDWTSPQPGILSLAYYPTRIALAGWAIYIHLMSRYFKYYEYSLHDVQYQLHGNNLAALQRWRRRSMRNQHRLKPFVAFIDYWLPQQACGVEFKRSWELARKDIDDVLSQLEDYSRSLEQMIPVATSMVQLLESQRALDQAADMRRLTWIAVLFVPPTWVATLFSMSDEFSLRGERGWVYFAVAFPAVFVVAFFMRPPRRLAIPYELTWSGLAGWRRRALRRETGVESA